jgi:hypothetical protein
MTVNVYLGKHDTYHAETLAAQCLGAHGAEVIE